MGCVDHKDNKNRLKQFLIEDKTMIIDTLAVTRGVGVFSQAFDFANSVPPRQIGSTNLWMLQILANVAPRLQKASAKVSGGGDDQIGLSEGADTVTVYLTEEEKNKLPDSGYSYKLYLYNALTEAWVIEAYGPVTASGDPPEETEVIPVPFVNGINKTTLTSGQTTYTALVTDDTIKSTPTTGVQTIVTLPKSNSIPGKEFKAKHTGLGTTRINSYDGTQIILLDTDGDNCLLQAGSVDENDWTVFFA